MVECINALEERCHRDGGGDRVGPARTVEVVTSGCALSYGARGIGEKKNQVAHLAVVHPMEATHAVVQ